MPTNSQRSKQVSKAQLLRHEWAVEIDNIHGERVVIDVPYERQHDAIKQADLINATFDWNARVVRIRSAVITTPSKRGRKK